ncbi:MAG: undecaprenyl-diphosphate phosphatase [Gammaproteobacteria bacterium]|nr:undecaprenyl-diphosphate phosphatase [Gammaproteobacteria bacterium]MDE0366146.1 undecaprenyl-diphosphate phosphatase [Gammaproteobacteria bacterium]
MDLIQSILLALLQGVTEFLPISSSAHLILPSELAGWPDQGLEFDIAVHLGSLAGVLAYFRRDCRAFAVSGWRYLYHRRRDDNLDLLLKIAVATLPIAIAGYGLYEVVQSRLRTIEFIAAATICFGLLLWWADTRRGDGDTLSWRNAMLIGTAQVLALVPGTSRSGIVISAALLLGLSRTMAARVAFLLAIPAIAGAALLAGLEVPALQEPGARVLDMAIGALVAGLSAWFCVHFFIALVERTGMLPYVVYRLILGLVLIGVAAAT